MTDVIRNHASALPAARTIRWNPSPAELRQLTSQMPNARHTEFDNYNVQTKVVSRSKASTYMVTDRPEEHSDQTMSRADGANTPHASADSWVMPRSTPTLRMVAM